MYLVTWHFASHSKFSPAIPRLYCSSDIVHAFTKKTMKISQNFINYYALILILFGLNLTHQLKFSEFLSNSTTTFQEKHRCLIVFTSIFQRTNNRSHADVDSFLKSMTSLILDFYEQPDKRARGRNPRTKTYMTLKVIMSHLNLSYSACPQGRSAQHVDIHPMVDTIQKQLGRRRSSELFWSGEIVQVKFMSVRKVNRFLTFALLIGPLGLPVCLATIGLIVVHILILQATYKLELKLDRDFGTKICTVELFVRVTYFAYFEVLARVCESRKARILKMGIVRFLEMRWHAQIITLEIYTFIFLMENE